jgi:DnaJ domain
MFSSLQQLILIPFRKRQLDSAYYSDDDVDNPYRQRETIIDNVVQEEDQGNNDMKDWTRIVPNNNPSPRRGQKKKKKQDERRGFPFETTEDTYDVFQNNHPSSQHGQKNKKTHDERSGFCRDIPIQATGKTSTASHNTSKFSGNVGVEDGNDRQQHPQHHAFQEMNHDEKVARQLQDQGEMLCGDQYGGWQGQQQQQQQHHQDNNPFFQTPSLSSSETPIVYQRISVYQKQREMQQTQLNRSISKTYSDLIGERPDKVEQDQIQRAIELSMLDCAIVPSKVSSLRRDKLLDAATTEARPPYVILGIPEDANQTEIKAAYRKLCRLHHPDKNRGSDTAARFQEISRAYKDMMQLAVSSHHHSMMTATSVGSDGGGRRGSNKADDSFMMYDKDEIADASARLKSTAHWDQELQDHRRLVNDLFQADGMDLQACVQKQQNALELLGLTFRDAGATNRNERDEIITNSCFYLSLAVSSLWGIGVLDHENSDFDRRVGSVSDDVLDAVMAESEAEGLEVIIGDQALSLKRGIEASVVKKHPEWAAQGKVGEEVQAFSDFLVYVLDTLMAEMAVVVFDNTSGFCEIYKGKDYDRLSATNPHQAQANTLTLRYIPGHYQPLIPSRRDARRPLLEDVVSAMDNYGVLYAICDGN